MEVYGGDSIMMKGARYLLYFAMLHHYYGAEWLQKHLDLKDKDVKTLFGNSHSKQKFPLFLLKETTKGIQILFQNKPITTYDRPHQGTTLHERVFNEIRTKFEDMGIDVIEISKLSLTNKRGVGAGVRS